jgi:predicted DNA-binding transcriptional regulator AlpA
MYGYAATCAPWQTRHMSRTTSTLAAAGASTTHDPAQRLLTTPELLTRLPISRRTLATHVARGLLPCVRIGRRVLWHWPSVEAALLRRQREAAQ